MEDFPIWLKMIVWLIVGATAIYAIAASPLFTASFEVNLLWLSAPDA